MTAETDFLELSRKASPVRVRSFDANLGTEEIQRNGWAMESWGHVFMQRTDKSSNFFSSTLSQTCHFLRHLYNET